MAYAYIDKYGILHAVKDEGTAKQYAANNNVVRIERESVNGYPAADDPAKKAIDVDTKNMTAKYVGTASYRPLDEFPECEYITRLVQKLK